LSCVSRCSCARLKKMRKIIFLFCLTIFSISLSHLSVPNQRAYAQEGGSYTCWWQTWSSSCLITNNCKDGYSPGACPDKCDAECQPPSSCIYPCISDVLPSNYYVCKEGPYGCQFDRDNCDENHYAGACVISGQCVTSPRPCEETIPPTPPSPSTCDGGKGIPTAIGCINVESPTEFVKSILGLAIGIGGGIAFLLMLFGAFQIMTSQGDPERLKAGKELIGSALAGLLMIIFSVFLLQLIGVQILQIPGFSK